MTERYLASDHPTFRHPDDEHPPLGTKLLILTSGGVCVIGYWTKESNCVAWSPLPRVPEALKERLLAESIKI